MSRIAIVTGAGSGIGRAVALALAADGWSVVLAGRRPGALAETAALAGDTPLLAVPTNVADPASVDALFACTLDRLGRVDLLFNNAGVSTPAIPLDALPVDTLRDLIDVNITGSMLCARAALGAMRRQVPQGGRIINNGSVSALAPRPMSAPYTASKHAMTGLTKALILDGRTCNVAASQIDIGNAVSEMTGQMATGVLQADGRTCPEPRIGVAHVAQAVVHMAGLPLDANIPFMTIMATAMPLYGRG